MTTPITRPLAVSIFGDNEPVIQSHATLHEARQNAVEVPRFGDAGLWNFNGVVRRNANIPACGWKITFHKGLEMPEWNLTVRELAMIMANPRHEAVIDAGVHLLPGPLDPSTIISDMSRMRGIIKWAGKNGLPAQLGAWRGTDLTRCVESLSDRMSPGTLMGYVLVLRRLHEYGPALNCGGPSMDPWRGKSARNVAQYVATGEVATPAIAPGVWFPLVRAAWIYVHTFAPDVLRAQRHYEELRGRAVKVERSAVDAVLDAWLADPGSRIPVHRHLPAGSLRDCRLEGVNWNLLSLFLGIEREGSVFTAQSEASRLRRERVMGALESGHPTTTGIIHDLVEVTRPDGTKGPWHPGLDPRTLVTMLSKIRDAAFCLVGALSMMRDSEIHEIRRGAVVEHYNAPAIASTLDKQRPGRPGKHWWITDPLAEAITVAESVSIHEERVFAPLSRPDLTEAAHGDQMIDSFIGEVNEGRDWSGLEEIPEGKVRPHMFRRTMAMLTDQFPGSEIALGIQLKHVAARALANRSTLGYAAADTQWSGLLQSAVDAARFRRFKELFGLHRDGKKIGYGPGADRVKDVFDEIIATVRAKGGDARTEEDLLRKARITIRFGMLNNCLFDESNPTGALCLENTIIPEGHTGPLDHRCRPDRCRNSLIGVEHVALHDSHRRTQLKLLETRRLPAPRTALIRREIDRVDAVLALVREENS
ncbi:integrase [Streptomyces fildesensis]|uniref:integrase n=1 Tax=Streptomyces fildesensis TaxID=375757 RepID=UPI0018DFB48D|nr:integrase [Streptomyces fildesensis]